MENDQIMTIRMGMRTRISGLAGLLYANRLLTCVKYDKTEYQGCSYKKKQATSVLLSSGGFNILVGCAAV